jgi:hypothetical protein
MLPSLESCMTSANSPGLVSMSEPRCDKSSGLMRVAVALQGGGSHGAFTWGVLDRLLLEPNGSGFKPRIRSFVARSEPRLRYDGGTVAARVAAKCWVSS